MSIKCTLIKRKTKIKRAGIKLATINFFIIRQATRIINWEFFFHSFLFIIKSGIKKRNVIQQFEFIEIRPNNLVFPKPIN